MNEFHYYRLIPGIALIEFEVGQSKLIALDRTRAYSDLFQARAAKQRPHCSSQHRTGNFRFFILYFLTFDNHHGIKSKS